MAPSAGTGPSRSPPPALHPSVPPAPPQHPRAATGRIPSPCGTAEDAQGRAALPRDSVTAAGVIWEEIPCHWKQPGRAVANRVLADF